MKTIFDENRRGGKLLSYLFALLMASFSMCMSQNAVAFSVCAVGDSITQGASNFTAHRIALEDMFDANTWEVVWKGTRFNSSYGTLNPCEGYSGYNAEDIAAKYEENKASAVADVLLLHAGHNYNADPGTPSPAYMPVADIVTAVTNAHARIIAAARTLNPNVIVLYAQVITSSKSPKYDYIPALNAAIAVNAAELDTVESPVVVVNMADGWTPETDCVSDHVHPTAAGAEKMAAKWFAALQDLRADGKLAVVSRAESVATLNVTTDMTLSSDVVCDTVAVSDKATLNMNGHKLSAKSLSGNGAVMSAMTDESPCALGYDLLSYVESPSDNNTDRCFIDTGYKPDATDRIETKVRLGSSVSKIQWLFGTYNSGKRMDTYLSNSKVFFMLGNKYNSTTAAEANGAYEIILDGSRFKATVAKGGAPTTLAIVDNDFTPNQCIYLFAANGTGTTEQTRYADECRMYYFRVFDASGNLKVNMLPVRNSSGTVGFYDMVRKTFYAPANGALTAGDVISYKALSYVATPADNSGTFIDTLYWPLASDRVETRVRLSNKAENQGLFSTRFNYKNNVFNCMMRLSGEISFDHYQLQGGGNESYAYHTVDGVRTTYSVGTDYDLTMDGGTSVFSVNGVASETYMGGDFDPMKTNFLLLATVDANTGTIANFAKGCRMYHFRVTDTNGYERLNLIPAQLDGGGAVGFYDATHNAFLAPASGSLEAGVALPRDLTVPGGTCTMSPSSVYRGTVANLFNDNFFYKQSTDDRVLVNVNSTPLPLRIDYDFGDGNAKAVNMYRIYAATKARAPGAWTLYGSNDSSAYGASTSDDEAEGWVALDVCDSQADWTHNGTKNTPSESRTKIFANDTAYRFYRLKVTDKVSDPNYLELVQLEYFRVENTDAPGVLNVYVARGVATTNSTVRLAGDLKLVKSGLGSFTAAKAGQGYLGGTDVKAGEFVVGAPLSTALTMADASTLGFNFAAKDAAPLLTLAGGSAFPSTLGVAIYVGGDFALPCEGTKLTSGYDFSGVTIDFTKTDSARRLTTDATGNLWVYGPRGFMLIFK